MKTLSLRNRLLVAATFTLVAFLGLAGLALDRAFIASAKVAVKDQLDTHVYALLEVFEVDRDGSLIIPEQMPVERLTSMNSNLYAMILDKQGEVLWRSGSSSGIEFGRLQTTTPGMRIFSQDEQGFQYSFGVEWELDRDRHTDLTWLMIDYGDNYEQAIASYRMELVLWLGMAAVLLLLVQAVILRWGLKPLGAVTRELGLVEQASQEKILGDYPQEIDQLSRRINLFIENERGNLKHYRNALDDLAHSLKTPLAVVKGITDNDPRAGLKSIDEMVDRMNQIVEYQLDRALSSQQLSVVHRKIECEEVLRKLYASMKKVYMDKSIDSIWKIEPGTVFHGDESDLFEFLGNIMDNAFKWAHARIMVVCRSEGDAGAGEASLIIEIHDDGPGIAMAERTAVLERGFRAEQQTPGQGIGLAVVREIVQRYGGVLTIESSDMGGALVRIRFTAGGRHSMSAT